MYFGFLRTVLQKIKIKEFKRKPIYQGCVFLVFVIYVIDMNGFLDVLSEGITMEKPLCMPIS